MTNHPCIVVSTTNIDQTSDEAWVATSNDPQIYLNLSQDTKTERSSVCCLDLTINAPQLGQLFWTSGGNGFHEDASQRCFLHMGRNRLTIRLPPGVSISRLRFDPAERQCRMTWHGAHLRISRWAWLLAPPAPHQQASNYDLLGRGLRALWAACPGRRQNVALQPLNQTRLDQDGTWRLEGHDPQVQADHRFLRGPLTRARLTVDGDGPRRIQFFWSGNSSFDEARSRTYHAGSSGIHIIDKPLPLPLRTLRLRIDPGDSPGQLASLHLQLFNDPWHPFRKILSVTQIWIRLQIHRILGRLHRFHRYFRPNRAVTVLPDIIIPVYNGFEILGPCLETTLANSPVGCRILVFDDASPDPRIAPLLETFRQRGDRRLTIIRNECNLGFVGTVNRGMAMGRGDVILLNSDTEVPPNWAKRMVDCWATDPQGIGTVTAMSNNATICSFPGFCKDNELWPGASAIDIDSVFQTLPNRPVHLPTAVGFCMFISRACLDSVGIFDEATFGRGYGEENDFCVRAQRKGYASVAATNCFVYHKGSVSFAADSKPSLTRNIALLQAKWSFYNYLISQFITQDPMAKVRIQAAVTLAARWRPKGKPVVIHLVSAALTGGTIKHVEELAAAMSDRVCSFIIKISSTQISMTCTTASQYVTVDLQENHCKEFMQELTGACTPSIYHLHHLIHLHDDWLDAIRSSGVRYTFTVHDYYSACPSYTLVNAAGRYCQGERRWSTCQRCVMTNSLAVPRGINIHKWRHHWSEFLKHATAIIAPSQAAASILAGYYPILPITVIPHGSPPIADLVHSSVANSLSNGAGPLTIACLGALGPSKGSSIIHALAENIESRGLPLRIVVIGYTDRIREATVLHNGALTITGRYQPSDLAALITTHRPHVALLPSLWPETFSYTLSECWMAGLPVLASNLGAIGERIQNSGAGWLLPDLEQSTILNELLRLHQDHAAITLATQCAHTVSSRIVGMDAMVNSHLKSYALEASL